MAQYKFRMIARTLLALLCLGFSYFLFGPSVFLVLFLLSFLSFSFIWFFSDYFLLSFLKAKEEIFSSDLEECMNHFAYLFGVKKPYFIKSTYVSVPTLLGKTKKSFVLVPKNFMQNTNKQSRERLCFKVFSQLKKGNLRRETFLACLRMGFAKLVGNDQLQLILVEGLNQQRGMNFLQENYLFKNTTFSLHEDS